MRHLLRLLLVVSSGLSALVVVGLIFVRDAPIAPYQPIPSDFLPGNGLPPDVRCEPAYYSLDYFHLYCQSLRDDPEGTIFVTFDERDKLIMRTTLLDPNKTVGALILA